LSARPPSPVQVAVCGQAYSDGSKNYPPNPQKVNSEAPGSGSTTLEAAVMLLHSEEADMHLVVALALVQLLVAEDHRVGVVVPTRFAIAALQADSQAHVAAEGLAPGRPGRRHQRCQHISL
jgi:hypothetical protein